ncbi:dermonecrotic toxin domain-containing protein [Pseudomonas sp. B8(2017)]|uniref:dermonecrotic toxin domain-containing protein n=1 Tax=Pseudomonas sp. B8(2017) TaxID=1981711 RepID=UPI000A1FB3F9|nr:DUF6543 domain-containing protein [Pseudomonas sp. B8(2017)]
MTTHLHPSAAQHTRKYLTLIPRPDRVAAEKIRQWYKTQETDLDPDTTLAVTLHYKPNPEGGWLAQVVEQIPLSQALLSKWQDQSNSVENISLAPLLRPTALVALDLIGLFKEWSLTQESWSQAFSDGHVHIVDRLPQGGLFGEIEDHLVYQGLFQKTEPMQYNRQTQIITDTQAFQQFIWNLNFHEEFIAQLNDYWLHQFDDFAMLARVNFIAACNKQVEEGSLSQAGCELAWRSAGIANDDDSQTAHDGQVEARMLNFYGYVATDIPCLTDRASGLTLLYIPGNSSPVHEFANQGAMKIWLVEQCKDAEKCKALMAHFRLEDLQSGLSYSGLQATLEGLGNYQGTRYLYIDNLIVPARGWSPQYINYKVETYSPVIAGSLFDHIALRHKQRSYEDAQFLITSNSDLIKAKWRGYLNLTLTLLAPLSLLVPGLGWLIAVGGIAQFGVGLDEVINGRNLQEKLDGVTNIAFGALCAAPLLGELRAGSQQLFRAQYDGFIAPRRINGQIGYPLSPTRPPRPRWGGRNFQAYFEQPMPVEPLPPHAGETVIRRQTTHAGMDTLIDVHNPETDFVYDLNADAFVKSSDVGEAAPTRFIAENARLRTYQPAFNGPRNVSNAMRESTLRSLGIELPLPVEVPRVTHVNQLPIPKRVIHLWPSGDPISPASLAHVSRNSRLLNESGFAHVLYLSNANYDAFVMNSRALARVAPDLQVLPLEHQGFYREMGYSKRYYDAAMEGPERGSSHITAANDILKYHALYHEGGLYMDINNDLLAPSDHPAAAGIVNAHAPSDWIGNVPLEASPDGLLLEQPSSNPFRGAHQQYNTSVIGSHPRNPSLRRVIDEMERRLDSRPGFFSQKQNWPAQGAWGAKYATYAKALSNLTGIEMFNHVVDRALPAYRQMKQIYKLLSCPLLETPTLLGADLRPVSDEELQASLQSLFRVNRVVRVNNGFAWRNLNH